MLYVKETTGSASQVGRRLVSAAMARGLRLVGRHVMKWNAEGGQPRRECRLYDFANVVRLRRILDTNVAAAATGPCRVAVDGAHGAVILTTVRPAALLRATGHREGIEHAEVVERAILGAIDEICGPATKSEPVAAELALT
jgi:uncharacterized protein (DUF302 family)